MDATAADRLLDKVRHFVADTLDEDERALFAALIAPGVARAYSGEVETFGVAGWAPADLPDALAEALREGGVRVEGLGL
jgi:hypothetical protein